MNALWVDLPAENRATVRLLRQTFVSGHPRSCAAIEHPDRVCGIAVLLDGEHNIYTPCALPPLPADPAGRCHVHSSVDRDARAREARLRNAERMNAQEREWERQLQAKVECELQERLRVAREDEQFRRERAHAKGDYPPLTWAVPRGPALRWPEDHEDRGLNEHHQALVESVEAWGYRR